ncbi:MAG: HEAT repeat domain-containing protein [Planctomycetota bacterium]|jgi:hypothetical protein
MRAVLLLSVLLLVVPSPLRADDDAKPAKDAGADMRKRFHKQFKDRHMENKAAAFRLLDPTSSASLPLIYEGFRVPHWLVRGAAARVASRIPEGPLRFQVRLDAMTHEEDAVREGLAYALSMKPLKDDGEALAAAMSDVDPEVRRDAARGLRHLPSRGGLKALIEALRREQDARVRVWILHTLRAIVPDAPEPTAKGWMQWWIKHKDDPSLRPPEAAEAETREFAGVKLEVVSVPARRRGTDRYGRRAPTLFVLDPFGWEESYFHPYLDALEERFHVHYIRLPSVEDLTGYSGYGNQVARYPVGKLAKAFEALRKDKKVERVVLFAEGASVWIAETYAAANRLARYGTKDERKVADKLLGRAPRAQSPAEGMWISRVLHEHTLVDKGDLYGHHLWVSSWAPEGFVWIPALEFTRRRKVETPALFLFSADSPLSGHPEAQRIRDSFPKGIVAPLEGTRGMPWLDVHDEFHRVIGGFVERHGLDRTDR